MDPAKDLILVYTVQLKPMIKTHSSVRMVSSGISNVVIASVHSEKIRLMKLMMMMKMMMVMMMIIIMNKLPETIVFSGGQKLTSDLIVGAEK